MVLDGLLDILVQFMLGAAVILFIIYIVFIIDKTYRIATLKYSLAKLNTLEKEQAEDKSNGKEIKYEIHSLSQLINFGFSENIWHHLKTHQNKRNKIFNLDDRSTIADRTVFHKLIELFYGSIFVGFVFTLGAWVFTYAEYKVDSSQYSETKPISDDQFELVNEKVLRTYPLFDKDYKFKLNTQVNLTNDINGLGHGLLKLEALKKLKNKLLSDSKSEQKHMVDFNNLAKFANQVYYKAINRINSKSLQDNNITFWKTTYNISQGFSIILPIIIFSIIILISLFIFFTIINSHSIKKFQNYTRKYEPKAKLQLKPFFFVNLIFICFLGLSLFSSSKAYTYAGITYYETVIGYYLSSKEDEKSKSDIIDLLSWYRSDEYIFISKSIYKSAENNIKRQLEVVDKRHETEKLAIVMDFDETIFSNLKYQEMLTQTGLYHSNNLMCEHYNKVIKKTLTDKPYWIEGAKDFLNSIKNTPITIHIITRRQNCKGEYKYKVEEHINLLFETLNIKRKQWKLYQTTTHYDDSKAKNKNYWMKKVAQQNHEILAIFGDSLGDFPCEDEKQKSNPNGLIECNESRWQKYYFFPNPIY